MDKEQLLAYAKKMLLRGDGYIAISDYLDKQGADKDLKKEIFIALEETEKAVKQTEAETSRRYSVSIPAIVAGTAFFALTLYLQHLRVIVFPWSLIGVVLGAIALINIIKAVLNIFQRH